jgi:cytochrome c5
MSEAHSPLIKTWQQLVAVVVAAFVVPIIVILLIASLVTSGRKGATGADESAVLARIQPVGTVVLAAGPRAALPGDQVYGQVCKTCHDAGLAGAPKFGDKAAWSPVIAQGEKVVVAHAIQGYQGKRGVMPPKGGNADLSDEEVHAAVVHIVNAAGANWKAPAPAPAGAASAAGGERTGEQIVTTVCAKCHEAGTGGAPKIGDRQAWLARAKNGLDAVYRSALKGHGGMPARGGMAELSDVEVKRAVEFMLNTGAAVAPVTAAVPAIPPPPAATAAARPDGKKVYDTACTACHTAGIAGAPKLGDKAAWSPRVAQGANVLYDHAVKGFQGKQGVMPPKGGNASLSDADVKAAVDYMTAAVK